MLSFLVSAEGGYSAYKLYTVLVRRQKTPYHSKGYLEGQKVRRLLVVLNHMPLVFVTRVSPFLDNVLSHYSLEQAAL